MIYILWGIKKTALYYDPSHEFSHSLTEKPYRVDVGP